MFWKPPCYCLDRPYYPFWPFLVFSPGPRHPLSGGFKWPLHFTLPPRSNALASVVFLTQVRLWELRTISVFGVGRSDAWSYGPLPSLITWEYRLLVSPVRGTIDQVSPQCAGGWSRGLAEEASGWWSSHQLLLCHLSFLCFRGLLPTVLSGFLMLSISFRAAEEGAGLVPQEWSVNVLWNLPPSSPMTVESICFCLFSATSLIKYVTTSQGNMSKNLLSIRTYLRALICSQDSHLGSMAELGQVTAPCWASFL